MSEEKISLKKRPGKTRKDMIKKCPRCKGKPTTVPFESGKFIGERCDQGDCILAVSWEEKPKENATE